MTTVLSHDPRKAYKAKRKRQQPERNLHTAVAEYLDTALPKPEATWHPIPNGAHMHEHSRRMMVDTKQLIPGVPDIHIVYRGRSIYIELKAAKGKASEAQAGMACTLTLAGAAYMLCRSVEDVYDFLSMLMPLKAKVQ